MLKTILLPFSLPLFLLFSNGSDHSGARSKQTSLESQTGTLEKMIVAGGSATIDVDLSRLNGNGSAAKQSRPSTLRFDLERDSFFTILVFNHDLRGPLPSAMGLIPQNAASLPARLSASYRQLVVESTAWGEPYELVVRDGKTGFVFFNIEGHSYDYDSKEHLLSISEGKLLVSKEFAANLGRPSAEGSVVGKISVAATMRAIEITQVVNGEATSAVMPSNGSVPGPDVIVGDLSGLAQFGSSSGTQVGLAVGTDSCNAGVVPLNWLALPNNDHPVIPQNLYRMSGGASNNDRFEQVGQSSVKHAFTALQQNICGFGCSATASTTLGSGCSDPYTASLNAGTNNALGSRAWINPFTGAYPRGDSATPPNNHTGHTHTGPSHRILVEMNDLNTTLNPGATYYAEAQYVTPHEYAWCVAHPGECNMNNNASYRQYSVSGTTSYTFTAVGSTNRMKPAISAWTGATISQIEPDPGNDGIGFVAYKVTNPSAGVWHYEYAVYNQNLDRAIQSFSVPLGAGITVSNLGFHAPPQQPGWAADGTVGNTGFSSTPWTPVQASDSLTWSSETFAQNQNANAVRWGTLYNYRFDSDRPPQTTNATVGFFKTGAPITVQIQAPISNPTASNGVVEGRITRDNGAPVEGAIVRLSGTQTRNTITDANGEYHFDDVETNGFYTVTPSRPNYVFSPPTRSFSQTGNRTEAAFNGLFTGDSLNPVESAEYFVRQQYLDFLGREPDQGGFNYWSDQINQCMGDTGCIRQRRIDVSAAFFVSPEFQQTGSYVYGLYAGTLGRAPGYGEFMADRSQVLGGSGLDQAKTAFAQGFVQRSDFVARYPQSMTREEFVDAVLQTMQQRSGRNQSALRRRLLNDYDLGSRALVVRHAAEADSFVAPEYHKAFVLMEYFGYLRRDVDQSGYEFWLNVLDNGEANNYRGMVCAFLTSTEYQRRFSAVVTHSNVECGR